MVHTAFILLPSAQYHKFLLVVDQNCLSVVDTVYLLAGNQYLFMCLGMAIAESLVILRLPIFIDNALRG
jgi:hypothetical protein